MNVVKDVFPHFHNRFSSLLNPSNGSENQRQQNSNTSATNVVDFTSVRENRLSIFQQALTGGFTQSSSGVQGYEPAQSSTPSAQDVADTVLGFVAQRLQKAAAEGASEEQLNSLLEQAAAGIEEGYGQAVAELENLGLLDESLEEDIGETYDLLQDGIEALREQFLGDDDGDDDSDDDVVQFAPVSDRGVSGRGVSAYNQSAYGLSESFDLQVTTRDGDVVNISLYRELASVEESSFSYGETSGSSAYSASYSRTDYAASSFRYSIEGELDEGEMEALSDLLGKVDALANDFFEGDVGAAFEQAASLNYDTSELVGFALNLSQTEVKQVTQAYSAVEQYGASDSQRNNPQPQGRALGHLFKDISDYVRGVLDVIEDASPRFEEPASVVNDLLDGVFDLLAQNSDKPEEVLEQQRSNFNDLNEAILEFLDS